MTEQDRSQAMPPEPPMEPTASAEPAIDASMAIPEVESPGPSSEPKRKSRTVRLRSAGIAGAVLGIVIIVAGAWTVTIIGELDRTRAATTQAESDTAATTTTLVATKKAVDDEQQAIATATGNRNDLTSKSEKAAVCISAQSGDFGELQAIFDDQKANFDRTATGSVFAKAYAAGWSAMNLAVDDMHNAYKAVASGNYSAANNWVDKADAAAKILDKKLTIQDKEITAINKSTDESNGARDALDSRLTKTAATCGV